MDSTGSDHPSLFSNDLSEDIRKFFQTPLCGTWTRWVEAKPPTTAAFGQFMVDLELLVHRAPNIHSLMFQGELYTRNEIESFSISVGQLRHLRNLSINNILYPQSTVSEADIVPFFEMISNLPCLKLLSIDTWETPSSSRSPDLDSRLQTCMPPASLRSVMIGVFTAPLSYLTWLLETRCEYHLDFCSFTTGYSYRTLEISSAMPTTLPGLKELEIVTKDWLVTHQFGDSVGEELMLPVIVNACSSLKRFRLRDHRGKYAHNDIRWNFMSNMTLPRTLEILQAFILRDDYLSILISSRVQPSSLRIVLIDGPPEDIPFTKFVCQSGGIVLKQFDNWPWK